MEASTQPADGIQAAALSCACSSCLTFRPLPKSRVTGEAILDCVLARALFHSPVFSRWFLDNTEFKDEQATCVFCRSNNPWSRVRIERLTSTGNASLEALEKECETDVLAVYETRDGRRLGFHVENKLAAGAFTPLQPELYAARVEQWSLRAELGNYEEGTSVLVAPRKFYDKRRAEAVRFRSFIAHEELARYLPMF